MKSFKYAAAVMALFAANSSLAVNWNVSLNDKSPYDSKPDGGYAGSFTYRGQTYGPSTAVAGQNGQKVTKTVVNLALFSPYQIHNPTTANPADNDKAKLGNNNSAGAGTNVTYRVYRQKYSGLIANVTKHKSDGTLYKNRNFVKHIVGDSTKMAALPNSGVYKYSGNAFINFSQGYFNYQIELDKKVGHGSFTLQRVLVPAAWVPAKLKTDPTKSVYYMDMAATLHTAKIAAKSGGELGVTNGNVTANGVSGADFKNAQDAKDVYTAVVRNHKADKYTAVNPKYNLNLYGPKAEEVAGYVTGMPDRIGGVAIIGKR